MKNIFKYILAAAAVSIAATACVEEETHPYGEPDFDGCYGVYFPAQEASGSHTYDPSMPTEVVFKASRRVSTGNITVPLVVSASEEGIFHVGDLVFEDGQTEADVKVTFPDSQNGVEYSISLGIEDPEYASKYLEGATYIDFSVLRVEWKDLLNPVTNQPAIVTFNEGWWGEVHTATVKYYEVNDVRYCVATCNEGNGIWGDSQNITFNFIWDTKTYNGDGYEVIDVKKQYFGFDYNDWTSKPVNEAVAPIYFYDWYHFLTTDGGYEGKWGSWANFLKANPGAYAQSYYDGNGGFFFNLKYHIPGLGGFTPDVFDVVALVDGYVRVDYTLEMEAGLTFDGEVPVAFYTGVDVDKIRFKAFEGRLNTAEKNNALEAVIAGTEEGTTVIDAVADDPATEKEIEYAEAYLKFAKTGVYTLVAATLDAEGNGHEGDAIEFTYVAPEDEEEKAVVISCGVGSAEGYRDANTDNSISFYVYGDNIIDAKIGIFSRNDMAADVMGCINKLIASKSVSDEILEAINGDGYFGLATKLLPGTQYFAVVYASNGYCEDVFVSESSIYTTGDPLPIYQNFSNSSYDDELEPESEDAFIGTWNLYATNLFGTLGMREYIGKAVITDSKIPDEGPDDYGYYDEYLTIKGLAGPNAAKAGYDDSYTLDLYGGYLYAAGETTDDEKLAVYFVSGVDGNPYSGSYLSYFIPVMDGYYAFVSSSKYEKAYNFCGLGFAIEEGFVAAYTDYLLVDPAKDENGLAPAEGTKASITACRLANEKISGIKVPYRPVENDSEIVMYNNIKSVGKVANSASANFKVVNVEKATKSPKKVSERKIDTTVNRF